MNPQAFRAARWRRLVSSGLCAAISSLPLAYGQTSAAAPAAPAGASEDEVIILSPFNVSSDSADRYHSPDAISAVRIRAPLLDTPNSITVLTRDFMDDLAPTRIFDVTRYAAGVQEGRGIQFQDRMILRGFESNGQRVVDNFLQPDDADNITEVIIERIEISKGPNAILSPAGGPGGAVNVITKSPLYRPKRSVTALVGMFDAQKVTMDVTDAFSPGSKFAYRLVGSLQDTRRYWDEDARLRTKALAPMFAYRISDRTQLTLKLVGSTQWVFREPLLIIHPDVGPNTDDPYLAPGLSRKSRNGIQPWSHAAVDTVDLFALLTTTFNENISLRVAANGRYYYTDSVQQFLSLPGLNNTRYQPLTGEFTQDYVWSMVNGAPVSEYRPLFSPGNIPNRGDAQWTRLRYANLQSDVVGKYQFGAVSSQTVGGFAISRRLSVNKVKSGQMPGIDLSQPDLRSEPIWDANLYANNVGNFTNWQVYVNERLGFFDDRVQATGGILHYDTYTYADNLADSNPSSTLDDAKNVWMASLLVKVLPNVSVYYSHSTNSSPVIANNQPLWRDGEQDEIGFKSEFFNQRLAFNAAYFEISQTNVTTPNPLRQTDPTAPEQIVQDLGNHGYEFELMGGLTQNLSIMASFSQLKMRDSLGRRVRAVADRNASLLLNYRFSEASAAKGLSFSFGVSYSGSRAGDAPPAYTIANQVAQVSFYLKPYYVTNFSTTYNWKNYVFRLYVDNVLDDNGYIQQAGGRVSGTGITTAPGINVKFSTTWNF